MNGEVRVVDDVASAYADLVANEVSSTLAGRDHTEEPFRLACSGGRSGAACAKALAARDDLDWRSLVWYFVDERCVEADSPESNVRSILDALGTRVGDIGLILPMSCAKGAEFYEATIAAASGFDLVQLGLGPDGHTASLFSGSAALDAPDGRLVVMNEDPSGANAHERMTLTYAALERASLAVFTVMGTDNGAALSRIASGEDLPAARVRAKRVVWLVDQQGASGLPANLRR